MEDQQTTNNEQVTGDWRLPATGSMLIGGEIWSLIAHGGVLGAGAVALGSAFVYFKGQQFIDAGKGIGIIPASVIEKIHFPKSKNKRSGRSRIDRLLGNFPDQEEAAQPHEDKPTLAPMEELQPKRRGADIVLSPELAMGKDEIIGKSIFVVGQRRSGKTTLGALLAEQIGRYDIPLFIPDSEGDLLSVYDLLPRGVIAAAPGSRYEDDDDVNLWVVTPDDADVLGFQILYEGMQVILDMSSFANDDEAWKVVNGVIQGLFSFANDYPDDRCPVEVFLDEAQKYLPQDLNTSAISDEETRKSLLKSYKDISGTGGKRGITPVILSQRFAETNNQIMAQSELRFILRQTQDNDLERCKKYVRAETATTQQIAGFNKGQGVFVGEDGTQLVTTFYQRKSDSKRSGTPTSASVNRFAERPLQLQQPVMRKQVERQPTQASLPKLAPKNQGPRKATKADAIQVWNENDGQIGRPSLQKKLQAMGLECSDYLAGELLKELTKMAESVDPVVGVGGDE